MAHTYQVLWAEVASRDLEEILEYIAHDSQAEALRQFNKIQASALRLKSFPERGRVVPELKWQGISMYRELILSPWRLIYRISGKTVYVFCFLDSRRNVEDLLLERLVR